jgi:hypothetical protein
MVRMSGALVATHLSRWPIASSMGFDKRELVSVHAVISDRETGFYGMVYLYCLCYSFNLAGP